jgi:hypothetical protein
VQTCVEWRDDGVFILSWRVVSLLLTIALGRSSKPHLMRRVPGFVGRVSGSYRGSDRKRWRLKSIRISRLRHRASTWSAPWLSRLTCEWETLPPRLLRQSSGPTSAGSGRAPGSVDGEGTSVPRTTTTSTRPTLPEILTALALEDLELLESILAEPEHWCAPPGTRTHT